MLMGGLMAACAQDVFVLGGAGTTPVPPIVYQPPVVTGETACQPVATHCARPVYADPYASTYYNPNVIYVGGPGTCSPSYYDYRYYSHPNVIYFGRRQAYREGYSFGHCR